MRITRIVPMRVVLAASLGLLASPVAGAQRPSARTEMDQRWLPWLGCWQSDSGSAPLVCIVPAAGTRGVDRVTIDGSAILGRERLVADSVSRRFARDGCRGIETGDWSASGHQLFLRAEFTCADSLDGRSATLFAFTPTGEWIESMQLRAARGTLERATRYRDAGLPSAAPKEITTPLRARQLAIATARTAALAPISAEEVSEATRGVGEAAVRPWLVTRGYVAEAAPASTPAPSATAAPNVQEQSCQTVVCYGRQYSTYNGPPAPPYPVYEYGAYGTYGYLPMISSYWLPAPLVVIGGTNRRPVRGGPQVIHRLGDRPAIGVRPRDHRPAPRPSAQQPMRVALPRRR